MKIIISAIFALFSLAITAQEQALDAATKMDTLFKPNYPEGVYLTKEAFLNKKPVIRTVWPVDVGRSEIVVQENIAHTCFFYGSNREKITDVFAVSYKGNLYFQLKGIFKNCNKNDRNESSNIHNSFVRVILGGENYFYTEAELANAWAKGFAYGAIGGGVGSVLAQSYIHGKGIVWDFKNQEFNIFKNCNDYNEFISVVYPEGVLDCKSKKINPYAIRKVIDIIK